MAGCIIIGISGLVILFVAALVLMSRQADERANKIWSERQRNEKR